MSKQAKAQTVIGVALAVATVLTLLCGGVLGGAGAGLGVSVDWQTGLENIGITVSPTAASSIAHWIITGLVLAANWIFAGALLYHWKLLPWQITESADAGLRVENERLRSEAEKLEQEKKETGTGRRVAEKSSVVNETKSVFQQLLNELPPCEPLDRKNIARWRDRCVYTLHQYLADNQDDHWKMVFAALHGAEDASIDDATEVRKQLERVEIQMKSLIHRLSNEMIRSTPRMSSGEYNDLYADRAENEALKKRIVELTDKAKRVQLAIQTLLQQADLAKDIATTEQMNNWMKMAKTLVRGILKANLASNFKEAYPSQHKDRPLTKQERGSLQQAVVSLRVLSTNLTEAGLLD